MTKNLLSLAVVLTAAIAAQAAAPRGAINGKFAVSSDKQVYFSQGNLRCSGVKSDTPVWSFAEHQYEILGDANVTAKWYGVLADTIDVFGYSTDNVNSNFGTSGSHSSSDFSGNFVDWGTNTIMGYAANTWSTLTRAEFSYLVQNNRCTMGRVAITTTDTLLGLMLLPSDFIAPTGITVQELVNKSSFTEEEYKDNVYNTTAFAQLEEKGVVFLPCAGYAYFSNYYGGEIVYNVGIDGFYWLQDADLSDNYAHNFMFTPVSIEDRSASLGNFEMSVRLVMDVKNAPADPTTAIENSTAASEQVRKVVRDGKVYILRGNQVFDILGSEVR